MSGPATPRLTLAIQYASDADDLPGRAELRRWAKAALQDDVVATLRLVDAEEGQALNKAYRRKDYATNVLTFAYGAESEDGPLTGDIVLCAPVVAREAAEQGTALDAHYAHLVVHGMLHLQGYDHERKHDAVTMESVETFIMLRMGFPDPYLNHE
jgi:probable rRNA maturation factor